VTDIDALADELLALAGDELGASLLEQLGVSAETLTNGHAIQLALVRDPQLFIVVLCSRRAGKTYGLACLALLVALRRPRQNLLYIGLSKPHARKFLWNEVWCPLLNRLDPSNAFHKRTEDEMTTTFSNGSIMYVSGTDDVRHIESFLGNRLNLAIVDEAQSQADSVLVPLTTRILPNALLDDMSNPGQLIMAGTIPEVNAGRFMEVWNEGKWSRHNWSRFENPHLVGQEEALKVYLANNPGLTEDSPLVQREWRGRFVFDSSATAYRFQDKASWVAPKAHWETQIAPGVMRTAQAPLGIDVVSIGVDPGGAVDRFAIVALGWNSRRPTDIYQLAEWVTPRGTLVSWDVASAALDVMASNLPVAYYWYDAGGSSNELALFSRVSGRYLLKAAMKADLRGQVEHSAALIGAGRYHVIAGGEVERDMKLAAWDMTKLAQGQHRWASAWHPDPADAARYAAQPFFALTEALRAPKTPGELADEQFDAAARAMGTPRDEFSNDSLPADNFRGYAVR
jgi:hypothetical protein